MPVSPQCTLQVHPIDHFVQRIREIYWLFPLIPNYYQCLNFDVNSVNGGAIVYISPYNFINRFDASNIAILITLAIVICRHNCDA